MRHVEHDVVGSPVFDEGFQLIFQILRLLTGKARNRKVAMEALRRAPVAVFAIGQLGLDVITRGFGLSTCATLNMILFVRRCSTNASNWFLMYSDCCPANRGIG